MILIFGGIPMCDGDCTDCQAAIEDEDGYLRCKYEEEDE